MIERQLMKKNRITSLTITVLLISYPQSYIKVISHLLSVLNVGGIFSKRRELVDVLVAVVVNFLHRR